MLSQRARPRPLSIPHRKHGKLDSPPCLIGGTLSPDIKPNTPPCFPKANSTSGVSKIGKYLLFSTAEKEGTCKAFNVENNEECVCKVSLCDYYKYLALEH